MGKGQDGKGADRKSSLRSAVPTAPLSPEDHVGWEILRAVAYGAQIRRVDLQWGCYDGSSYLSPVSAIAIDDLVERGLLVITADLSQDGSKILNERVRDIAERGYGWLKTFRKRSC
jgi:hypothetical protein